MTTNVIFADSNDGYVDSDSTNYTTMRNGNSMTTASNDRLAWGQALITGTYWGYQSFVQYTFSANAEEKITAAHFRFKGRSIQSTTPVRYVTVMEYDWGGSVETADWRNSSSHGGTMLGNIYAANDTLAEYCTAGSDALIARLASTSPLRVQLNSDGLRAGSVPTVNEVTTFYSVDQTGTADDPVLVYTTVIENNLNGVLGAAVQLSDGTHVYLERSGTTITLKHHNGTSASTVSTLSTGTGASSFSLPTNGCGPQQLALTRDNSDHIYVVGARGSAPVTDIAVQSFAKGAGYSWTAGTVRTATVSTYVEGALNNFATVWADLGTGGSLLTMYSHTHGRATGSADESGFCSLDANYVRTGTGSLVRSNGNARGSVVTGAFKAGYHNHHMNETGTMLDVDKAVGDETRHYNYSVQATHALGDNDAIYSTRIVMNSNGVGHSNAYTADQGSAWGTKDGNSKLRVIGVNTTDYVTCSVDADSGYGPGISFLRNTGTNTTWTLLEYADLDGVHASIPASATLSKAATWDLLYESFTNTVWFYYLNASDQRQLMRIGFNLTSGTVGSPVTVASNIGAAGCENSAIRVPRQRVVGQKILIAIGSETTGGVHSTEYVLDDLALTVTLTGHANTSAVGSPAVLSTAIVNATSVASTSAIGQPAVQPQAVTISATGRSTQSAYGSPALTTTVTVSPTGVASSSAVGQPAVTTSVSVTATGVSSTSAYGQPAVQPQAVSVNATGVASGSAYGQPVIATTVTVNLTGRSTQSAYGTPTITTTVSVSPAGVVSSSAYGSPALVQVIAFTGVASTSSVGQPAVQPQAVTVNATGVGSSSAYGGPTLSTTIDLVAVGAVSSSAYGQPAIQPQAVTVTAAGVASSSAVGSPTVTATVQVALTGVGSTSVYGSPAVAPQPVSVALTGVPSGSGYGQPAVQPQAVSVVLTGVGSGSGYGAPAVQPQAVTVNLTGTGSTSSYGTPTITTTVAVSPAGVASSSAVGQPAVTSGVTVLPVGVPSSSAYGAPSVEPQAVTVTATGVATTSAIGLPAVQPQGVDITATGVASTSATGSPAVTVGPVDIDLVGVASGSGYGGPTLSTTVDLVAIGAPSASAVGQPLVQILSVNVDLVGVPSSSATGQPAVTTTVTVNPTGVTSTSSTGSPAVNATVQVDLVGVGNAHGYGQPSVTTTVTANPVGVSSISVVGQPNLTTTVTVALDGAPSESAVGAPRVGFENTVFLDGVPSTSDTGQPEIRFVIGPVGVTSGSAVGLVLVEPALWQIEALAVASTSAVGLPRLADWLVYQPNDGTVTYDRDGIVYQLPAAGTVPYPPDDDDIVYQLPAGDPLVWH